MSSKIVERIDVRISKVFKIYTFMLNAVESDEVCGSRSGRGDGSESNSSFSSLFEGSSSFFTS